MAEQLLPTLSTRTRQHIARPPRHSIRPISTPTDGGPSTTINKLASKVERLVTNYQLSSAGAVVRNIADIIHGVVQDPLPTLTEQRDRFSRLHPPRDDNDILNVDRTQDPMGLQVSEEDVRKLAYKLNKHASHGSSGWTNLTITTLFSFKDRADRGGEEVGALCTAFTQLINSALDGSMADDVAYLWATSRAVLIPKDKLWRVASPGHRRIMVPPLGTRRSEGRVHHHW